jgi:ASC-1-like (ASCH) protein
MGRETLKFASWKNPDDIFKAVKTGDKTIETRPATAKYRAIQKGDELTLLSLESGEEITKMANWVHYYQTIEEMAKSEEVDKIVPGIKTAEDLIEVFEDFKRKWGEEYTNKLKQYGIVAIGLK